MYILLFITTVYWSTVQKIKRSKRRVWIMPYSYPITLFFFLFCVVQSFPILSNPVPLPLLTADGSHRGTLPSYTFGSTGSRVRQRDRFKQDRVTHYGDDSPGPCQYVTSLFMIHVGGTRCVTSSTDNIMKIHAWITLTVEFIRGYIFLFLFDV